MKTKFLVIVLISLFVISVLASAVMLIPADDRAKEKARADSSPAIEKADEHWVLTTPGLERIILIHFAKPTCDNDGICEPELGENPSCADCKAEEEPTTTCYAFLGAKWKKVPVNYVIDPDNSDGLTEEFVTSAISTSAETWDDATVSELFNDVHLIDYESSWDINAPDGRNELVFGDYPQDGVIAVTVIWGYFTGKPSNRRIVEFDILFDDTDYVWGDATNPETPTVMDLQNIATHELGHGAGLGDLYSSACAEETMYGYSDYSETKKRTLEQPDITGLQTLYGV